MEYTYEIVRSGARYAVIRHGRKARKMYVSPRREDCAEFVANCRIADEYRQREKVKHDKR